jgi:hypothetical protein
MQLSDTEKKIVARLRKRQQSFIRWRWGFVLSSIICIGCGIYGILILQQCFRPDFGAITILAIATPGTYVLLAFGAMILTYTIINWNGKPEVILLLRLIEESQDDDA